MQQEKNRTDARHNQPSLRRGKSRRATQNKTRSRCGRGASHSRGWSDSETAGLFTTATKVRPKKICDPRAAGGLALVGLEELNRTARLKFWDRYAEGDRIWVGLARHSLAHHASSLDNHSHSSSPFSLICFRLSITEPFWLSALKILKASPPAISASITLPQLLSLPPTYPKLLHLPSTLVTSTKSFLRLPSLATLFHLQPTTSLTYSTFSTPANSTKSPSPIHYSRLALDASSFQDADLQRKFGYILHFGAHQPLPDPEPPDIDAFVSILLPTPEDFFLPVLTFANPILSPPPGFWPSIWTGPTPMRAAENLWTLAHGSATTEIKRNKYDTTLPNTCTLCPPHIDTAVHRFFDCPLAATTWNLVFPALGRILGRDLPGSAHTPREILFGFPEIARTLNLEDDAELATLHNIRALRAIVLEEIQNTRYHLRSHPTFVPNASAIVLKATHRFNALLSRLGPV
ncbi:hypothetical protein P7C70_g7280, partial [Phenoliferia sp. Uapishka_3]